MTIAEHSLQRDPFLPPRICLDGQEIDKTITPFGSIIPKGVVGICRFT